MQFAMFAIAITNEPNIATVGDVVIQVGVGVTGRLHGHKEMALHGKGIGHQGIVIQP